MKIKTLLLLSLLMSSCITTRNYVEVSVAKYSGYNLYLDESASPNIEYRPLGNIEVFYAPAKVATRSDLKKVSLDLACEKAKEMGANGIINLKFVYDYILIPSPFGGKPGVQLGYRTTGMAIKRK
ncbi:MAG: hypothetical protein LBI58_07070 [Tannerellaceae bacterium]|jgi:hypothetical protein|nr:hypothetical protein [Tannerellaceae bacterium]